MLGITLGLVATPFVLAGAVLLPRLRTSVWPGRLALVGSAVVLILGIAAWREIWRGAVLVMPLPWIPDIGISASLRLDRLGVFFVLLVGTIGLGVFQYARAYLGAKATAGFWSLMLAFTGAMLGIVVSDDLVLLYLFWELTTVTSALLIARTSREEGARRGALQAFLVTSAGGLALLAGIIILGSIAGTYRLSELLQMAPGLLADPRHEFPLALMLAGALAKSAQVPLHFWLPGAMAAPAPVSAYLHSATMVKAGVFLVARLFPVFSESPLWFPMLSSVGVASFVVGGWNALVSDDVKKLLAYSTVAYLGLLIAHLGNAARVELRGELIIIASHALYKSALFLLVGWVEKATGTRDLRTLAREKWPPHEPVGTALFALGALALAGSPLLLGFVAKEIFLEAVFAQGWSYDSLPQMFLILLATALSFAQGLKIFTAIMFGSEPPPSDRRPDGKVSRWLLAVPAALLAVQLLGGLAPGWLLRPLVEPDAPIPKGVAVWHHVDILLVVSIASFALGTMLFKVWRPLARTVRGPGFEWLAARLAGAFVTACGSLGRMVQSGGHSRFGALILFFAVVCIGAGATWKGLRGIAMPSWGPESVLGWAPSVTTVASAILVLFMRTRTAKAVMLAVVGYGISFYYVLFRAPDLVLTQILVETVSLVLLLLVFRRLPPLASDARPLPTKVAHAAVAVVVGAAFTGLTWATAEVQAPQRSGLAQLDRSWVEAHGRNVVNVILVDFRGADTLGEIIVLAIAALGALLLGQAMNAAPAPSSRGGMHSFLLSQVGQLLLPIAMLFALYLLLRGHHQPGGGFSAGVVTTLLIVIQAFARGFGWTTQRLAPFIRPAFVGGLSVAFATALAPVLFGKPFFTHFYSEVKGPEQLRVGLTTTLLFDVGVFATVVATTAIALSALSHETQS